MVRTIPIIRVISATLACAFAAWFITMYSAWSLARFQYEHRDENCNITAVNQFLLAIGGWGCLVPTVILATGLFLVFRHPKRSAFVEVLVQSAWLFAFASTLFAILSWQGQNIPMFDLRGAHF